MITQIQDDHENAQQVAKGISQIKGLSVDKEKVKTNIIYFELESSKLTGSDIVYKMKNRGVNFFETSSYRFRMVTHYGITLEDVKNTLLLLQEVMD